MSFNPVATRQSARLANNPIFTKGDIGQPKPVSYALPDASYAYGYSKHGDAEGAAAVMGSYRTHEMPERSREKLQPKKRDFVAVNRDALRAGCKNPSEITKFRGDNKPMIKIARGVLDKGTTDLPSKQDNNYTYGVRNPPSTPISGVISGSYAAPDPPSKPVSYEEEVKQVPTARRKIRMTRNQTELRRQRQHSKEREHMASRQFKMKRFQKADTKLYERGPHPGKTFARSAQNSAGRTTGRGAPASAGYAGDMVLPNGADEGADEDMSMREIQKKIKKTLKKRGAHGIRGLGRAFRIMDDSGNRALSRDEFQTSLGEYGIDLSDSEMDKVMEFYDRNGDGVVIYDEFLTGLRGDLNKHRLKFVHIAFDRLDADNSGLVTLEDVASHYDVDGHPDVLAGKLSPEEALSEFMSQWDSKTAPDGIVTREEFENYYRDVSASVDDDEYFELMMRNAWRIAGGSGAAANTANLRVLVTWPDQTQTVEAIEDSFGLRATDIGKIKQRIIQQTGRTPISVQIS